MYKKTNNARDAVSGLPNKSNGSGNRNKRVKEQALFCICDDESCDSRLAVEEESGPKVINQGKVVRAQRLLVGTSFSLTLSVFFALLGLFFYFIFFIFVFFF